MPLLAPKIVYSTLNLFTNNKNKNKNKTGSFDLDLEQKSFLTPRLQKTK